MSNTLPTSEGASAAVGSSSTMTLAALASAISGAGANILSVETPSTSVDGIEGFIEFRFKLEVKNLHHLQKVSKAIEQIPQVRKVTRA